MHKLGNIVGFIFNKFFVLILSIFIIMLVPVLAITTTLTDKEAVKSILSDSKVYSTIPENILDVAESEVNTGSSRGKTSKQTLREVLDDNKLIDPEKLIATVKASFDSEFLQTKVEGVLDIVYGYLSGSEDEFKFNVTLKDRAEVASKEFKLFVSESLKDIPKCTKQQAIELDQKKEEPNILELECLPPGAKIGSEIDKFIDEALADDGVLAKEYTQKDVDLSSVDLRTAQLGYRTLNKLPVIFWSIVIGLSAVVIMTSKNIHKGFKIIGVMHFSSGLFFIAVFAFISKSLDLVDNFALKDAGSMNPAQIQAIRNIGEPLADAILKQLSSSAITSSIILIGLGIVSYILGIILTKHHVEHLELHHHEGPQSIYPEATKGPLKSTDNEATTPSAHPSSVNETLNNSPEAKKPKQPPKQISL